MNSVTSGAESWEEVIIHFLETKVQNIKPKKKCKLFSALEYIQKKEKEIETEKDEKKLARSVEARKKKQKEYEQLKKDAASTEVREWLDATSKKGKQISEGKKIIKATHVLKFTHSSAPSAGLLLESQSNDLLLSTSSLKKRPAFDLAHNNGALITVSRFLALSLHGKQIIDLILDNDFCFLEPFARDNSQLSDWVDGFRELVEEREIKTADKGKQLYFPTNQRKPTDGQYHILVPLFPSSLVHEVNSTIITSKYGDMQKELNKLMNEQTPEFRTEISTQFPNLAIMQYGGEHPKNVSMLNADRGGKAYLFSSQPPQWHRQLAPPVNSVSLFYARAISYNATETIGFLRDFLLWNQQANLSIKDPKKKKWIDGWVNQIIDEVFTYVFSIQNLPAGWSALDKIKLKTAHRYLLDPYRPDEQFRQAWQTEDWQKIVCSDFAKWLNGRLVGKDKQFTPQPEHSRMWQALMAVELRDHCEALVWDIKQQQREERA